MRTLLFAAVAWCCVTAFAADPPTRVGSDWPVYGGDKGNSKYSPTPQISISNVSKLKIAWRWHSADEQIQPKPDARPWLFEATPLKVRDKLYVSTSLGQVAAINGTTGKTIWVYDPKTYLTAAPSIFGFAHRGVSYWADTKANPIDERLLMGTVDGYLIALNTANGKPVAQFGRAGRVDLTEGLPPMDRNLYDLASPPVIIRDVVVIGSGTSDAAGPNEVTPHGDVRGFDVRTGKLLWTFHSVPQLGEVGNESWLQNSWKGNRGVSAWAPLSADDELGYVYLPFSTPSNDYYGGDRPGDNLFSNTIVCLEAKTGKLIWHFQTSHHDTWDYDPPAAPTLVNVKVGGKQIKALAQVTKQGFVFVLDRATGEPVWPIVEKPVAQSKEAREHSAPTQPFPSKPAAFDRQGVASEEDLIDFTPELRQKAREILKQYNYGPLFTPPSFKGTVSMPGATGGGSWAGAGFDPETGILYVPSITRPTVITLHERTPIDLVDPSRRPTTDAYFGTREVLLGPDDLPLFKPPFGRITAIDLNTGEHKWMIPSGEGPRDHPLLKDLNLPKLGWPLRTFVLVTKTLLFAAQEGPVGPERRVKGHIEADHVIRDAKLRAYNKVTGKTVAEFDLPANATGSPMTYMMAGKQYIVVAVGGSNLPAELVAFALP